MNPADKISMIISRGVDRSAMQIGEEVRVLNYAKVAILNSMVLTGVAY